MIVELPLVPVVQRSTSKSLYTWKLTYGSEKNKDVLPRTLFGLNWHELIGNRRIVMHETGQRLGCVSSGPLTCHNEVDGQYAHNLFAYSPSRI